MKQVLALKKKVVAANGDATPAARMSEPEFKRREKIELDNRAMKKKLRAKPDANPLTRGGLTPLGREAKDSLQ
jgi:hypothetical protein